VSELLRCSTGHTTKMATANWPRTYSVGRDGIGLSIYRAVFRPTEEEFTSDSLLWGPRSFGLWRHVVGWVDFDVSKDPWEVKALRCFETSGPYHPACYVFWVGTQCCWVSSFRSFEGSLRGESTKVLRNIGPYHPACYEDPCLLGCDAVLLGE
jgi:hypothetical protein